MAGGRPTDYNEEIVTTICAMLADGMSMREICRMEEMPSLQSVYLWIRKYPEFAELYTKAKQDGLDAIADEILDIADNAENDWMERKDKDGNNIGWQFNGEAARRSQIRIDARKWLLSKLAAKKYGDKITQEVTGADGGPVEASLKIEFVKPRSNG